MKKTSLLKQLAAIALATLSLECSAQTENPRGIYKMMTLTGKQGEIRAPFDQYKICRDEATISLFVDAGNPEDIQFRMNINDEIVFNYTGKVPQGEDGHGSQIYDSNGKEFKLRWWSMHKGHALFPDNDWVVEKYERDKFSKPAEEILNLMKEPPRAKGRDYYAGRWVSMGERESAAEVIALKEGIEAGKKKPDRISLIRFCIRFKLDYYNSCDLLKLFGYCLSPEKVYNGNEVIFNRDYYVASFLNCYRFLSIADLKKTKKEYPADLSFLFD